MEPISVTCDAVLVLPRQPGRFGRPRVPLRVRCTSAQGHTGKHLNIEHLAVWADDITEAEKAVLADA